MQRWVPPDEQHPALDAVRKLTDNVKKLKLSLSDYLEPLKVHVRVHVYTCICICGYTYITHRRQSNIHVHVTRAVLGGDLNT